MLTGGDPLKRADLFELIRHAVAAGLQLALTPSATPLATFEAFERVREAGVRGLGISLDGADAATHDAFRGWEGSFERTMRDARQRPHARNARAGQHDDHPPQRRTRSTPSPSCWPRKGIAMWSVFFLVPVGRGVEEAADLAGGIRDGLRAALASRPAPALRGEDDRGPALSALRAAARRRSAGRARRQPHGPTARIAPRWASATARAIMFVSHTGEIYPAGFLPLCCGRFPHDSVVDVVPEPPHVSGPARSRRLQGPLRRLRVSPRLRRQPRRAYASPAIPGDRAGLHYVPLEEPDQPGLVREDLARAAKTSARSRAMLLLSDAEAAEDAI